jgi:hypothetical protein
LRLVLTTIAEALALFIAPAARFGLSATGTVTGSRALVTDLAFVRAAIAEYLALIVTPTTRLRLPAAFAFAGAAAIGFANAPFHRHAALSGRLAATADDC